METRAHHLLIGLFTVAVVAAALAFALWMGGAGDERYEIYDVLFDETVSGLSKGSAVEFKGIRVGVVDDLRLDPADPRRVRARIHVEASAPIYADTLARLNTASITGLSTIRLSAGSGAPLRPSPGVIPVIPAEPSSFSKLINGSEDVIFNANAVLTQIQGLLSERNLANITRSLENLEHTTAALAAERGEIHQSLKQLALASTQANAVFTEAAQLMRTGNRLLGGQGQNAFDSAQRSMAALESTMSNLDKLLADNRAPLNASLNALAELGPAVAELRATLASLRTITRRLEERPADYLLGLEPTREFKP
ncbi:MAG: MlaD family protein [Azoarcus sp.]|jgi:phospholipid/cholesterol/gamma-HCH transport system substrate-binding protein|nr:MlaD family protein [Azoarcus sp.]